MKKKALQKWITTVILASTCLSLIGCGAKKTAEVETETETETEQETESVVVETESMDMEETEEAEDTKVTAFSSGKVTSETSNESDLEDPQLALIQEKIPDINGLYEESYLNPEFFITDLDQDGLKEIIVIDTEGSGHFSEDYAFEVNESMDDLVAISDDSFQMDGFLSTQGEEAMNGYYDEEEDRYYYVMVDGTYAGTEYGSTYYLVYLGEDGLVSEPIADYYFSEGEATWTLVDGTACQDADDMWAKLDSSLSQYTKTQYTVQGKYIMDDQSDTGYVDFATYGQYLQESSDSWSVGF